ncbi:hypothetical protein, conserved [Babesia ovata]|uniref:C3H1-type domain-containing protein n=1 Tax=Babesia ovata TaxID=189622 RepID=A0A2H6KIV3_9APIC|nr:uncharacterized protein BOVATA_044170 [Babesia ovata]GBE62924.1 hypothetical protein, conserved [Babesia ovata]
MCHFISFNFYLTFFPLSSLTLIDLPPWPPSSASIDWLIQVKHGNGNTNGLKNLADALKKLIGEAINSANTSLTERQNHLNCLGHHSFDNTPKSHCQSLNEQIDSLKNSDKSTGNSQNDSKIADLKSQLKDHVAKYHSLSESDRTAQLKDIQSRMVSLAELSGKLGQFIGKSEAVTKAIKNAINTIIDSDDDFKSLKNSPSSTVQSPAAVSAEPINGGELSKKIKHYEELKKPLEKRQNDKISPLSSEDSRLLSSYESKLDALQRLKSLNESLSSLSNNNDNCKKLLENLCTGLEKFLGYSNGNYTGSGIVYSDLDRLCDGVMSFLLECLKGSEPLLKHYYSDITNTISDLESKIGKGHGVSGFASAIGIVQRGLQGYESSLNKKINDVVGDKTEHNGTLKALNDNITKNIHEVNNLKSASLDDVVADLAKRVYAGLEAKVNKVKEVIKQLDGTLQAKLNNDFEKIDMEVRHLKKNAQGDRWRMEKLKDNVDKVLTDLKSSVDKEISHRFSAMRKTLNSAVLDIQEKVREINKNLQQYVKELTEWIAAAESILTTALQKIEQILDGVKDGREGNKGAGQKTVIHEKADGMKTKADRLHDAYEQAREDVAAQASLAVGKIKDLENVYVNKLNSMKQSIDQKVQDATSALSGLSSKVTEGLEQLRTGHVNTAIQKMVQRLQQGIERAGGRDAFNAAVVIQNFYEGLESREEAPKLHAWSEQAMRSGSLFNTMKNFDSIPRAFYTLKDVLNQLSKPQNNNGTFFSVLTEDLQKKVEDAINKVKKSDFQNVFSIFHREITQGGGDTTVHGKIEKIKDQFKDQFEGDPGQPKIKDESMPQLSVQKEALSTEINKTHNEAFQAADGMISGDNIQKGLTFRDLLSDITGELTRIAGIVDNNADGDKQGLKQILEDLKTSKIKGNSKKEQLTKIKQQLSDLQKTQVTQLDAAVTTLLSKTLPDAFRDCKEAIKNHLGAEVSKAKKAIKSDALNRYVTSKILDLEALHKFVDEKHDAIRETISIDLTTGIKGMLGMMKYWLNKSTISTISTHTLSQATQMFKTFYDGLWTYIAGQINKHPSKDNAMQVNTELTALLAKIISENHFSREVSDLIKIASTTTETFAPSKFTDDANPLLQVLKEGVLRFTTEVNRAYVSAYSGIHFEGVWWTTEQVEDPVSKDPKPVDKLSTEGCNCAKVCLTILERVYYDLHTLWAKCDINKSDWRDNYIHSGLLDKPTLKNGKVVKTEKVRNPLGTFFAERGYIVATDKDKHDGELRNKTECKGEEIYKKLITEVRGAKNISILAEWKNSNDKNKFPSSGSNNAHISLYDIAHFLRDYFRKYYKVCQHKRIDKPKAPSNIYQMLCWLSGLRFNPMYSKLGEHFKELFDKPEQKKEMSYKELSDTELKLVGTATITPKELKDKLDQVCLRSQLVLIHILGHGHAEGRYACDFRTNIDKLSYPSNPSACFDMLLDILNRVFYQSYFLYSQCRNSPGSSGWADCHYGRHVGGSSWNCNEFQCPKQDCEHKHNQTCNKSGDQKADQHYMCGLKSPLQSFLEDGLQGFLPHTFISPGCKLTCSVTKHSGIPCLTPMGFTEIGIVASHTKNGTYLKNALYEFCNPGSHLNQLCSYLQCLLRRPPQTLCDMLAFYCQFLKNWNKGEHKKTAFDKAVIKANFWNEETTLNVVSIQGSKTHSDKHDKGDLFSLTDCYHNTHSGLPCGKYLQPLTLDVYDIYSKYNSSRYLSWVVYTTETFLGLLYDLYESCKKCEKPGTRCSDKSCVKTCKVKYTNENGNAVTPKDDTKHQDGCHSIVKCPDMHPTLYKYGFTFGSPHKLSGQDKDTKLKRTCKDFCHALKRVIGKTCVLVDLIHDIDKLIWGIREKFSYLLLTLWSLSLLYLLHVTVVRLDVLRIRSHLRSPSSHRIAAQSLLAAARVKALANDARDKALKDIKERTKNLEGLAKKLKEFIGENNSDNPSKVILENLTEGLEKFVGYNKASKGYDGTGIVYSDLDRLCDGVMSFLHGVLGAVNDNPNLSKYNSVLPGVLDKITDALYNREKHFDSSIRQVSDGIRQWVRGVDERNKGVMRPLESLQLRINGHMDVDMHDNYITDQLSTWQGFAGDYLQEAERSEEALSRIDDRLKEQLLAKIELIKSVAQNFWNSVNDPTVDVSVKSLKEKFTEIPQNLNKEIGAKITAVQSTLNEKFEGIRVKIEHIRQTKERHIKYIKNAVEAAQTLAQNLLSDEKPEGFKKGFKEKISEKFTAIKTKIETLTDKNSVLMLNFLKADEYVKGLEDKVRHGLQELLKSIESIATTVNDLQSGLVKNELEQLGTAKGMLDRIAGPQELHLTAGDNLEKMFKSVIQKELSNLVTGVDQQIKALCRTVGNTSGTKIKDFVSHVKEKVNKILNGDPRTDKGLQGIETAVREYAQGFTAGAQGFERTLETWVTEILKSEMGKNSSVFNAKIKLYVMDNNNGRSGDKFNSEIIDISENKILDAGIPKIAGIIQKHIMEQLRSELTSAQGKITAEDAKLDQNVGAVKEICTTFVNALEGKIVSANITATEVAGKIETESDGIRTKKNKTGDSRLTDAVQHILNELTAKARKAATELEWLAKAETVGTEDKSSIAAEIDAAKGVATELDTKLGQAVTSFSVITGFAGNVDSAMTKVRNKVVELPGIFNSQVKQPLDTAVKHLYDIAENQIKNAAEKAIEEAVAAFKMESGNTNKIDVPTMMTQFEASRKELNTAVDNIQAQIMELQKLPGTVDSHSAAAGQTMENLKHKIKEISDKITASLTPIDNANRAFDTAILQLQSALEGARGFASVALPGLQRSLQREVNGAFSDMEEYVQGMFNAQRKADFQSMQACFVAQIPQIQHIVDTDTNTGLKGLMKRLNETFDQHNLHPSNTKLHLFGEKVEAFLTKFLEDVSWQEDVSSHRDRMTPLTSALLQVLSTMNTKGHFHQEVSDKIDALGKQLHIFTPKEFADASPLLNVIKRGVTQLHEQLRKQYVSRYSGETFGGQLVETKRDADGKPTAKITEYGTKCAKLCLTILPSVYDHLTKLKEDCEHPWKHNKMCLVSKPNIHNHLGHFLQKCGYEVTKKEDSHDGELKFPSTGCNGKKIHEKLNEPISEANLTKHLTTCRPNKKRTDFKVTDILKCIHSHIDAYYKLGHLLNSSSKRHPCSVYEKLIWLCGLPCNSVFLPMLDETISDLFSDPRKQTTHDGITLTVIDSESLPAYPQPMEYDDARKAVTYVCSTSYDILTGIVGTGDANTMYGVDFYDNSLKLHYPQKGEDCLNMLLDVLRRLFQPLKYLYLRCGLSAEHNGWRDCPYGKDVPTAKSHCERQSTVEATGQAKCRPTCQAKCEPNCQPTSPLMSYLNDCLPGHLPHHLSSVGCKSVCSTCPTTSRLGMPCLTPLGFRGFCGSTKRGSDMWELLDGMFADEYIPSLFCLVVKPPSTLPEHFQFALTLVDMLNNGNKSGTNPVATAFETTTKELSIELCKDYNKFTSAFTNAYNSHDISNHRKSTEADLYTMSTPSTCMRAHADKLHCAPYLQSLYNDTYTFLAEKHCHLYLSWAVYLPWTFCQYLKSLLDAFSNISCQDWGCGRCVNGDKCKTGKHGIENCRCRGLVECRGVQSALYQYGFTFGNPQKLSDSKEKRYCHHFYIQLSNIVNSTYFQKLFEACDEFLKEIRWPFMLTLLALWSLSLLYLLHITVVRLDVLRIRSHLRSPQSHRIAAQSLLAAARVRALANVKYFSP